MNLQKSKKGLALKWVLSLLLLVHVLPSVSAFAEEDTQSTPLAITQSTIHQQDNYSSTISQDTRTEIAQPSVVICDREPSIPEVTPAQPVPKRSKRVVETALDVASLGHSVYSYNKEPSISNAVFVAWDAVATVVPGAPGSYVAKGAKAIAGHATDAGKSVKSTTDFVVSPNGVSVAIPNGAHGPLPNINKSGNTTGFRYDGGAGGNGLHPETYNVRIMDPIPSKHGKPSYPYGYAVYMNKYNQTINPYTGKPTQGKSDPWGHLPLK